MPHAAYVFDAYGTLFDVHSAVNRIAGRIGADAVPFSELWRSKQLEYSWVRTLMDSYRDFWSLTGDALDFTFQKFPAVDRGLRDELLGAYRGLKAFPDVESALRSLRQGGARLAILSNGSPCMLESAVAAAGLDGLFDAVFSVDVIRTYKTSPDTYRLVTQRWGLAPDAVSFQSSNRWDVAGAMRFGFRTVWANRPGQPDEYGDLPPARTIRSLARAARPLSMCFLGNSVAAVTRLPFFHQGHVRKGNFLHAVDLNSTRDDRSPAPGRVLGNGRNAG